MHLVLVNRLGSFPRNSVDRLSDRLDMTIVVDWDVKPQIKIHAMCKQQRCQSAYPYTLSDQGLC